MTHSRNLTLGILVCILTQALAMSAHAQATVSSEPPSLLDRAVNSVRVGGLSVYGRNQTHSTIDSDVQGGKAVRITVSAAGTNPWDVTAAAVSNKAVDQGDKLVVAVWLRTEQNGSSTDLGQATLRLQETMAPYTGIATERIAVGTDWTLYFIKGTASRPFEAGALAANVQLASRAQIIDIGPAFILAMGPDFDLSTIPAN